jgi:hypothetical protein
MAHGVLAQQREQGVISGVDRSVLIADDYRQFDEVFNSIRQVESFTLRRLRRQL